MKVSQMTNYFLATNDNFNTHKTAVTFLTKNGQMI